MKNNFSKGQINFKAHILILNIMLAQMKVLIKIYIYLMVILPSFHLLMTIDHSPEALQLISKYLQQDVQLIEYLSPTDCLAVRLLQFNCRLQETLHSNRLTAKNQHETIV